MNFLIALSVIAAIYYLSYRINRAPKGSKNSSRIEVVKETKSRKEGQNEIVGSLTGRHKEFIEWLIADDESSYHYFFSCFLVEEYEYNNKGDYCICEKYVDYNDTVYVLYDRSEVSAAVSALLTKDASPDNCYVPFNDIYDDTYKFFDREGSLISDNQLPDDYDFNPHIHSVHLNDWKLLKPKNSDSGRLIIFEANNEKRSFSFSEKDFVAEILWIIGKLNSA